MATGFNEIIAQLESQKAAIEKALSALREVDGSEAPAAVKKAGPGRPPKKGKRSRLSAEGRERLVAALKARWAAKKAGAGASAKKVPGKRGRPKKTA